MEEKANTGQVIIVLTEHLTFGTLLIPYMAEKSDDGMYRRQISLPYKESVVCRTSDVRLKR